MPKKYWTVKDDNTDQVSEYPSLTKALMSFRSRMPGVTRFYVTTEGYCFVVEKEGTASQSQPVDGSDPRD